MTIKDILVHVDTSEAAAQRVEVAASLAQRFDAHLTGFYPHRELEYRGYTDAPMPKEVIDQQRERVDQRVAAAKQSFLRRTAGVKAEWRTAAVDPVTALVQHAHYVDLLVCGQEHPSAERWPDESVVEAVIMESARPCLLIPYIGSIRPVGKRIYVAWDGSREAVRAAHDAMPLLVAANSVRVIAFNPDKDTSGHGEIPCADFCLHLARHDVNAEAVSVKYRGIEVGEQLLSRAFDDGIDLIVMGAYGHSRLKELVLGGVTRTLLKHMTIPLFMSH